MPVQSRELQPARWAFATSQRVRTIVFMQRRRVSIFPWTLLPDDRRQPLARVSRRGMFVGEEARAAAHAMPWVERVVFGLRALITVQILWELGSFGWRCASAVVEGDRSGARICALGVFIFGVAFVVFAMPWWWVFWRTRWMPAALESRLSARRCAACRYSLPEEPQADGCTVCPECGAAWKLPPLPPNNPA